MNTRSFNNFIFVVDDSHFLNFLIPSDYLYNFIEIIVFDFQSEFIAINTPGIIFGIDFFDDAPHPSNINGRINKDNDGLFLWNLLNFVLFDFPFNKNWLDMFFHHSLDVKISLLTSFKSYRFNIWFKWALIHLILSSNVQRFLWRHWCIHIHLRIYEIMVNVLAQFWLLTRIIMEWFGHR